MTTNPESLKAQKGLNGGEFLIKETAAASVFIPEDFNEEQLMVRDMVLDFLNSEVMPVAERFEKMEPGLAPALLKKMGDLGLLGSHMQ